MRADAPRPTAVVFDLGGVILDWNPRHLYRKLFAGDEAAMERFLATVVTPAWNTQLDLGRPFREGIAELVAAHPAERERIEAFWTRWEETVSGPIHGSLELLDELRERGVPLYGLTNFSAETFPRARRRFPCLDRFDDIVVSGEEGVGKPDPRVFERLLARAGRRAEECLFFDDSPQHVAAATALGFTAVRFESAAQARQVLVAQGVLAVGR